MKIRFKNKNPGLFPSAGILIFFILAALFAGYIAPHDPEKANLELRLKEPCREYPLGTDHLGRCISSRIIFGARVSLSVGLLVVSSSLVLGLTMGTLSGYYGGWPDGIVMRVVDAFLAFPSLLLALGIAGLFGAGFMNLVIALIVVDWAGYARLARSSVMAVKEQDYIKASKGLGAGDMHVIVRRVIPNVISPLIVMATIGMGYVILSAAGLSFLGFGVQPPTPEWGSMLNEGKTYIRAAPYIMIFSGLAIMLTVLAFNCLGDELRDLLDSRTRKDIECSHYRMLTLPNAHTTECSHCRMLTLPNDHTIVPDFFRVATMKKHPSSNSKSLAGKPLPSKFLLTATINAASGYVSKINGFSRNASLFLGYVFLISLSLGIYDVIFNLYILRLGFREDFLGLMLSLVSISTGLFAIPAAAFCDRVGRKNTLLLSCLLLLISFAILYTTKSTFLLAFFSVLYGISSSLKIVTASTFMVENSTSYERMHLFSMYYLLYTIGVMLGNLAGGTLPQVFADSLDLDPTGPGAYQLSLYASLAAVLVSLLPLLLIKNKKTEMTETGMTGKPALFSTLFSTLRSGTIRKLILVNGIIGIGWGLILPYFNVYFDIVLGASSKQIGFIFSFSQLVMMFTLMFVPILTEGFGKVKVITLVQLSSIPFLLLFASTSILAVAAFGYTMRTAIMNMANPIMSNFNMEIVSEGQRATVNSLIWMSCYTFVGLSTYAGGLMMAHGYYTLPFLLTCGIYGVAAVLYYMFFEKIEKQQKVAGATL